MRIGTPLLVVAMTNVVSVPCTSCARYSSARTSVTSAHDSISPSPHQNSELKTWCAQALPMHAARHANGHSQQPVSAERAEACGRLINHAAAWHLDCVQAWQHAYSRG